MNAFKKPFDIANGFTTFTTAACHMPCTVFVFRWTSSNPACGQFELR